MTLIDIVASTSSFSTGFAIKDALYSISSLAEPFCSLSILNLAFLLGILIVAFTSHKASSFYLSSRQQKLSSLGFSVQQPINGNISHKSSFTILFYSIVINIIKAVIIYPTVVVSLQKKRYLYALFCQCSIASSFFD